MILVKFVKGRTNRILMMHYLIKAKAKGLSLVVDSEKIVVIDVVQTKDPFANIHYCLNGKSVPLMHRWSRLRATKAKARMFC